MGRGRKRRRIGGPNVGKADISLEVNSDNVILDDIWAFVVHHTDCGMEFFTDAVMRGLLANSLETAALGPDGFTDVGAGPGSAEGTYIDWLTISDAQRAVVDDVTRIRHHPLVPGRIPIHGFLYDVRTGRLLDVPGAHDAGQPG